MYYGRTGLDGMNARNVKNNTVHSKKKAAADADISKTGKRIERKQPRKRKAPVPKKQTIGQRVAQQGPLRSALLLSSAVLVVCLYAWFVETDMEQVLSRNQGIIFVFFGFIGFHILLIYIGYRLGVQRTRRKKKRR